MLGPQLALGQAGLATAEAALQLVPGCCRPAAAHDGAARAHGGMPGCDSKPADEEGKVHRGVCSNYLCDLKVGDTIQMTGPSGTAMVGGPAR